MFTNFLHRQRAVWQPDMFHGWGRERSYFEGWYLKMVDATGSQALAIIPGISMDANGEKHAFIQVMNGTKSEASYFEFPAEAFQASTQKFELNLAGNYFSAEKMILDLPNLQGEVRFKKPNPWPKMLGAPGIMGWFGFVPFMQCYHGIVSMNHEVEGVLILDNREFSFTNGGKGYIEKDWGTSFPQAYVWMQSNHFEGVENTSLFASAAHIPWLGTHFIGFISGFLLEGKLWRFATYNGTKMNLELSENHASLLFQHKNTTLRLHAQQAKGVALVSPITGAMVGKINESLLAKIHVELRENGHSIYEGTGQHAGMELAGNLEVLVAK